MDALRSQDPEIYDAIVNEAARQDEVDAALLRRRAEHRLPGLTQPRVVRHDIDQLVESEVHHQRSEHLPDVLCVRAATLPRPADSIA